jgi:hypothetical protein
MLLNRHLRKALKPVGVAPRAVGSADWRDMTKAQIWAAATRARHIIKLKRE